MPRIVQQFAIDDDVDGDDGVYIFDWKTYEKSMQAHQKWWEQ